MSAKDRSDSERLAVIEEILSRMEQRLFGNGQPGAIAAIDDKVAQLQRGADTLAASCPILSGQSCAPTPPERSDSGRPGNRLVAGVLLSGSLVGGLLWHVGRWVVEKGAEWLAILHPTVK